MQIGKALSDINAKESAKLEFIHAIKLVGSALVNAIKKIISA